MRITLGEEGVHLVEELEGILSGLALELLSHEGSGSHGDGAAAALETEVADLAAVQLEIDRELVTAQGVEALLHPIGPSDLAEVPRAAVVIHDHVAVEILEVHQRNISRALCSAATRASRSVRRL